MRYPVNQLASANRSRRSAWLCVIALTTWCIGSVSIVRGEPIDSVHGVIVQEVFRVQGQVVYDSPGFDRTSIRVRLRAQVWTEDQALLREQIGVGLAKASLPEAFIQPDGTFVLEGLKPGTYHIGLVPIPRGWWLRSALMAGKDLLDTDLTLRTGSGELPPVVFTLTNLTTRVAGTLQGEGIVFDRYSVVAFPRDSALRVASRRRKRVSVAADGRFVLDDLPAGEYFIAAVGVVTPSQLADPRFLAALVDVAQPVVLQEGKDVTQNLQVSRKRISGL